MLYASCDFVSFLIVSGSMEALLHILRWYFSRHTPVWCFYRAVPTGLPVAAVQRKQINDALLRTLEAEREGTPIAVEDGHDAGAAPLLDLDGGTEDTVAGKVCCIEPRLEL